MTTKVGRGLASFTWLYDSTVPFPADGNKRVIDYTRDQSKSDPVGYVKDLFIEFSTETNPLQFRNLCAIQLKNTFYSRDRVKLTFSQQKWRDLPDDVKEIIRKKLMEMACSNTAQLTLIHKNVALLMGVIAAIDFPSNVFFGAYTASNFIEALPQNVSLCVLNEIFEYVKSYNWMTDEFVAKALNIAVSGLKASNNTANVSNWLGAIESIVRFASLDHTLVILDLLLKLDRTRLDSDVLKALFSVFTAAVDRNTVVLPPNAFDAIITAAATTAVAAAGSLSDEDVRGVIQTILDLFAALAYRNEESAENNIVCKRFIRDIFPVFETIGYSAFKLMEDNMKSGCADENEEIIEMLNTVSASLSDVTRDVVDKYPDYSACTKGAAPCGCVVCNILKPIFAHVKEIASTEPLKACVALETLRVLAENNIPMFNIFLTQETKLDATLFSIAQEVPHGSLRTLFLRFIAAMDSNYYYLSQVSPDQVAKLETFLTSFPTWLRDSPAVLLVPFCSCACGITAGFVNLAESGVASIPQFVLAFVSTTFDTISNTLTSLSLPSLAAYRACSELVCSLIYNFYAKLPSATPFCASLCKMFTNVVAQKPATIGTLSTEVVIPCFVDIMNEFIPNMQIGDALKCFSIYVDLCSVGWFSQSAAKGIASFRPILTNAMSVPSLSASVPQAVRRIVQVLVPYINVNEKVGCSSALDVIAAYVNEGTFNAFIAPEVPQLVTLLCTKVLPFAWHLVKPASVNLLGSIFYSRGAAPACPQQARLDVYTALVKSLSELSHVAVENKDDDDDVEYVKDVRYTVLDVFVKLFRYIKDYGFQQQLDCVQLVSIALDAITYYYNDWDYTSNEAILLIYDLCVVIFTDYKDVFKAVISAEQGLLQNVNEVIRGFETSNAEITTARLDAMTAYLSL